MTNELLTSKDAERHLEVSRATVTRMAKDGRLTPVKTTPLLLFTRADVERLARERAAA